MMYSDLPTLAAEADAQETVALDSLEENASAVFDACQSVLGHMVKVTDMLASGLCHPGDDFDLVLRELIAASTSASAVQVALARAIQETHTANMSAAAAAAISYIEAVDECGACAASLD